MQNVKKVLTKILFRISVGNSSLRQNLPVYSSPSSSSSSSFSESLILSSELLAVSIWPQLVLFGRPCYGLTYDADHSSKPKQNEKDFIIYCYENYFLTIMVITMEIRRVRNV
jgi:hypothetical protein